MQKFKDSKARPCGTPHIKIANSEVIPSNCTH